MAVLGRNGYSVDTTLLVPLPIGAFTASIVNTTNWPEGANGGKGNFIVVVDEASFLKELILVSKNVGGVLTIVQRGYANTIPYSHAAGATISVVGYDADVQDQILKNITLYGLLYESATDGIAAFAGGGQSSAYPISTEIARVTTVTTAGDSVKLPPITKPGLTIIVVNHGANPLQVFGSGSDQINDQTATVGVTQMVNSDVIYTATRLGSWYSSGLGSGYNGSLPTVSYQDTITAHAGGGQASATQLAVAQNRVTVVATAADSVKLPVAAGGLSIVVSNAHASNALAIFPSTGDQVNNAGVNVVYSLAAGKTATFSAYGTLNWHAQLSA